MIRYALVCDHGHEFESWFQSSSAFESQSRRKLVSCPTCDSTAVERAIMAPNITPSRRKVAASDSASQQMIAVPQAEAVASPQQREVTAKLRELRDALLKNAANVGERFPEEARKMHYGETEHRAIYGEATLAEAKELIEEGVSVAPIPVLPDDRN
jgi:hypothetical protein